MPFTDQQVLEACLRSLPLADLHTVVDPWKEAARRIEEADKYKAWDLVLSFYERATEHEQFEAFASGPLIAFRVRHVRELEPQIRAVAPHCPALINSLRAVDRRMQLAAHVMRLAHEVGATTPRGYRDRFTYLPRAVAGELCAKGSHPVTEGLRLINPSKVSEELLSPVAVSREEIARCAAAWGKEEWAEAALKRWIDRSPAAALDAIHGLCGRSPELALAAIGMGPLEDLLVAQDDRIAPAVMELARADARLAHALAFAGFFDLGENCLWILERGLQAMLR